MGPRRRLRLCYTRQAFGGMTRTPVASSAPGIDALREAYRAHGQDHVFAHWDRLGCDERSSLLAQAERLLPCLASWSEERDRAVAALATSERGRLEPAEAIALPEHGGSAARLEEARIEGERLLRAGRVGAFVVAGGQGTRLGFPRPKGGFPVGPITDRSLFALQAQKLRGLARRLGRVVPWYVMTSPATDAETRALFEESRWFGLSPEDVVIFSQDLAPACDFDGRLILERPDRIAESPNGHGGALLALANSGALADMERRGVDRIFYFQVDNPLIRMADPVFLGFHEVLGAEMSCKVVRKTDPNEKVGVVANIDGRPGVVEYTEIQDPERSLRDPDGRLVYWAGSIAIHVLNRDFVARVGARASEHLPYHASAKSIPFVDPEGRPVAPTSPNGYKLERFVFDALPAAERVCVLEVRPDEEFSPIKNADGSDSPQSARRDLTRLYRRWLEKAGIEVREDVTAIEIDHAQIDSAEEAADCGIRRLEDAGEVIRVATGMDA